jgi:hypothetical protein
LLSKIFKKDSKIEIYKFKLTLEIKKTFKKFYNIFISFLVIRYFNLEKRIKIIIDILKIKKEAILL